MVFNTGDTVQHEEGITPETVLASGVLGGREVIITRDSHGDAEVFFADGYRLATPPFPRSGAQVRRTDGSEAVATIEAVGFNRGWYIVWEGTRIEVTESYLLAHYEEAQPFPREGAKWRRKHPGPADGDLYNRGTIGKQGEDGSFEVHFQHGAPVHLERQYIVATFEEDI